MTRALSIGMVCFPTFGGSGIIGSELAVAFAQRGHRVHLIASAPPSRELPRCERLTFHRVNTPSYPMLEHAPYTMAMASAIIDIAQAHTLDLVHVHYAVPHAVSAYLAHQALGAQAPRVIVSLHGTDVTRVGKDPAYLPITRFAVAHADGVTVPSEFLRREAHKWLGLLDEGPVEVISNFVDTEHFVPAETPDRRHFDALFPMHDNTGPVLFHVSNFRPIKRVPDVIEVLARVRRSIPARLVLVGDGPSRPDVEARARELGVAASVCFLGKRSEFAEDLRHADVFVLPSESESFGLAALEALSSGVPVCAYHVDGLPEVVTPEVGKLVAPFDVDALATAVIDVTTASSDPTTQRHAARAHAVAHFRRQPIVERYESHYRRVLVTARRGS